MTNIWEYIKDQIAAELPQKSFSLWINPLTLMEQQEEMLVLGCPNKFSLNWISENYKGIMEEKLNKAGEGQYKISLKVATPKKKGIPKDIPLKSEQMPLPEPTGIRGADKKCLNHEFTFDRFVVGKCNEFAYTASKALATSAG